MCGIFGHTLAGEAFELADSRRALNVLTHRGPDQWGDWRDEAVYIGHRRLSILDLSQRARQPMVALSGAGMCTVIAVNGEIWNYRELRRELADTCNFRSGSDSEVILHGYQRYGLHGLIERIDGMYAFAVYDQSRRKIFLVRDRYGVKPMFFALPSAATRYRFLFASEVKAFFEFCDDLRVFSLDGVCNWLTYRNGRSLLTLYHDVYSLPPGHCLSFDVKSGGHELREYYSILNHVAADGKSDADDFGPLFSAAVQKRLMSDVPLGLQLSGGVDSSLVAEQLARLTEDHHCNSFNIGFKARDEQRYSEEGYARHVAGELGFVHHQVNVTHKDILAAYRTVVYLTDGMLAYPNTIPIYLLSRHAKSSVTVQLTGEGADELFGGYTKFAEAVRLTGSSGLGGLLGHIATPLMLGSHMRRVRRTLFLRRKYGNNPKQIIDQLNCYIARDTIDRLFGGGHTTSLYESTFGADGAAGCFETLPFFKQLILADHLTYLVTLLDRQDRASMGASIESRVPFLDRDLIEWGVNLDEKSLYERHENKVLLKQRCAEIFGSSFSYRKKMGFPLPIVKWLKIEGFAEHVAKVFSSDFVLRDVMDIKHLQKRMTARRFDNVLLNYADSERIWLTWFMMVLRTAQDVFQISDVCSQQPLITS